MEGAFQIRDSAENGRYNIDHKISFRSDGSFTVLLQKRTMHGNSNESGTGKYTISGNKVLLTFSSKEFSNPEGNELTFTTPDKTSLDWPGIGCGDGNIMRKV